MTNEADSRPEGESKTAAGGTGSSGAGPAGTASGRWEQRMNEAGQRVEEELRRVMRYIDDEVVPEIRRNGSTALRYAATELERLARSMDDRHGPGPEGKA